MRAYMLLPLIFLGLAGCVVANPSPAPTTTSYVAPAQPAATTTVIRTP